MRLEAVDMTTKLPTPVLRPYAWIRHQIKELVWWWTWRRFVYTFVPMIHDLQDKGVGRRERWIEPETPVDDFLAWIDFQVNTLTISGPCLSMTIVMIDYTAQEHAAKPLSIAVPEADLPWQQLRSRWSGPYAAWTTEGRPQIAAALDHVYAGMFVVITSDGAALAEITRRMQDRQDGRPSLTQAT